MLLLLELQASAPMPRGGASPGSRQRYPLRPVWRLSRCRTLGILDGGRVGEPARLVGGGVEGLGPRTSELGEEGTEEPSPPPDVALGRVEGGIWSGVPMPNASMKSETLSKFVDRGAEGTIPPSENEESFLAAKGRKRFSLVEASEIIGSKKLPFSRALFNGIFMS